jgi:hypothetical protein
MAEVLIEVPDPLGLQDGQAGQLLLGDYVEVQISGQSLQDVAVLPRSALHSGDRLWLAVNDRLQIRQVRVLWKDTTKIVVPFEFSKDTRLVVSDLNTPVEGMALRRAEELQIKPDRKGTPAKGLERLGGQS